MKSFYSSLILVLLLAIAGSAGCAKKISVDTVKLEYSFQAADQAVQTTVTEAIEAIDKADYSAALAKLKKASAEPKLTPEQKAALTGVIAQLEK